MKIWNDEVRCAALLSMSMAGGVGCRDAWAGPARDSDRDYDASVSMPVPVPMLSASPRASASGSPQEPEGALVDGHKPWSPTLDVTLPETPSEAPTKEEWGSAAPANEVRVTDPSCKVQRVREWYRLECQSGQRLEMISGSHDGVSFGCSRPARDATSCDRVWIVFPARRGDRRALEVLGWSKWGPEPDAIATEQFLEGDPCPLISVQGIRWRF